MLSSQLICSLLQVNQSLFSAEKSSFDRFLISKAMKSNCLSRYAYGPHFLIPIFVILCLHCKKKKKKVLLLLQCNTALHKMLRGFPNVSWSEKKKIKSHGVKPIFFLLKILYSFFQKKKLLKILEHNPIINSYLQAHNFEVIMYLWYTGNDSPD